MEVQLCEICCCWKQKYVDVVDDNVKSISWDTDAQAITSQHHSVMISLLGSTSEEEQLADTPALLFSYPSFTKRFQ